MIYSIRTLLTALFLGVFSLMVLGQASVDIVWTAGSYPTEPGYEIVNTATSAVVVCRASGTGGLSQTLTLPYGTYSVRGFDSYGDGWNGGTLKVVQQGLTVFTTSGPANVGDSPSNNTCTGTPSPVNGTSSQILGTFNIVQVTCTIACPANITVNNDPGVCGANVTVPTPTTNQCQGTVVALSQNFSSCALPTGWTTTTSTGTYQTPGGCGTAGVLFSFACADGSAFGGLANANFTNCIATINDDDAGSTFTGDAYITSPVINLSSGGTTLDFDYTYNDISTSSTGDYVNVEVWNGTAWVVATTFLADASTHATINISAYNNTDFRFRIHYNDGGSWAWGFGFDNVVVRKLDPAIPTPTNDFNNTSNASGFYPIGTTTVKWSVVDASGFVITCNQTVTVTNTEPIIMTCPDDMTITLDPGDCEAYPYFATPTAFSCNGFLGAPTTLATSNNGTWTISTGSGGMMVFNVTNGTTSNVKVSQMAARIFGPTVINIYKKSGTYVGFSSNAAAWTLVGTVNVTTGPFAGTGGSPTLTPFPVNFTLPPGLSAIAVAVVSGDTWITPGNNTYTDGALTISTGAAVWPSTFGTTYSGYTWNGSITYAMATNETPATQIAGPATGEPFPIGTTTVTFTATDLAGYTATCSFDVTVNNYPNPISTLACNDEVQVSVDENCEALINADMVLEGGPYSCYNDYNVEIFTQMPSSTFNAHGNVSNPVAPGSYWVGIYDQSGNNCWGHITVLDKLPPFLFCRDVAVECDEPLPSVPDTGVPPYAAYEIAGSQPIVGGGTVSTTVDVVGGPSILDINVKVDLNAIWLSDGTLTITSPQGTPVQVIGANGCYGEYAVNCVFDDESATTIFYCTDLDANGASIVDPWNSLSPWYGEDPNGTWKFDYYDYYDDGDNGNINSVVLQITTAGLPGIPPHDACGPVTLTHTDVINNYYCQPTAVVIHRTWVAVDESGNSSTCVQNISVLSPSIEDFTWPLNWDGLVSAGNHDMLECDGTYPLDAAGNPHPNYTGWPANGNDYCGTLEMFYNDDRYVLSCGVKILRNWTVVNDCTGEVLTHTQVIRITDKTAPTFMLGTDQTASARAYECLADFNVPTIMHLHDACDPAPRWWVTTTAGVISGDKNLNGFVDANETWSVLGVPMGDYSLCYHAIDNCGNESVGCVTLHVIDNVPPIPVCEQFKQVSLTAYGSAKVFANDFDSGSFDNCGNVYFKVLRVNNNLEWDGGCKDASGKNLNLDHAVEVAANKAWYDDEVFFCCSDLVAQDVMVSMRVFDVNPGPGPINPSRYNPGGDLYGHFNDCWSIAHIECKIPPSLSCPDVTVTCEESLDPKENPKLQVFPSYVCDVTTSYVDKRDGSICGANIVREWSAVSCGKTTTCKQKITVTGSTPFDPCSIQFPADKSAQCTGTLADGGKPTWLENPCNVITSQIINEDTFTFVDGACMKILRDWAVIDWCVYEPNTGAEDNVDPVTASRKIACKDKNFVADGYYTYTQILMVVDTIRPEIVVEDQCVATTDCEADNVEMSATANDECNDNQKFWWKYIVINLDTWETVQYSYNYVPAPLSGWKQAKNTSWLNGVKVGKLQMEVPLEIGHYRVTWTVGDGCGNATSKYQYFQVADKKAPTPVLVDIATAVMSNGMVALRARTFDKGCGDECISCFDNCTPKTGLYWTFTPMLPRLWEDPNPNTSVNEWDVQYATYTYNVFDPTTGAMVNDPAPFTKFNNGVAHRWYRDARTSERAWNCNYNYGSDFIKSVPVYVWDKFALNDACDDNNYDYADVTVTFTHCSDNPAPLVVAASGTIRTYANNDVVNGMDMKLVNPTSPENTFTGFTNNGLFSINVNANNNYNVSGIADKDYINGITTLDLVLIQKYLLNLKPITDPFLLMAGDMNNDGKVTSSDIATGRSLILGKTNTFANHSWMTINTAYQFQDATKPASEAGQACIKSVNVGITDVTVDGMKALKIGDINKSAGAPDLRSATAIKLMLDNTSVKAGQEVTVPFYAKDFTGIYGSQFALNLGSLNVESVESGKLTINDENYRINGNSLFVSWNNANGVSVDNNEVLFTLKLKATENGQIKDMLHISDMGVRSEVYTGANLDVQSVQLGYRNADANYALYQNEPNPFVNTTTIGFELPKASNYTLTVYDATGKELKVLNNKGVAGYNTVNVEGINATGVLTYRLQSDDFTATKKMVSIK